MQVFKAYTDRQTDSLTIKAVKVKLIDNINIEQSIYLKREPVNISSMLLFVRGKKIIESKFLQHVVALYLHDLTRIGMHAYISFFYHAPKLF